MRIESYNPADMQVVHSDVTGVDFGTAVKGNHASEVVAIRPVLEMGDVLTALALFLENDAGLDHTQFGKYKSHIATQGIEPGSAYLSDYFTEQNGLSDIMSAWAVSDQGLVLDPSNPEYIWMDAGVGSTEDQFGASTTNFRFIFEYV